MPCKPDPPACLIAPHPAAPRLTRVVLRVDQGRRETDLLVAEVAA